jgi:hypothetical protein
MIWIRNIDLKDEKLLTSVPPRMVDTATAAPPWTPGFGDEVLPQLHAA